MGEQTSFALGLTKGLRDTRATLDPVTAEVGLDLARFPMAYHSEWQGSCISWRYILSSRRSIYALYELA